MRLTRPDEADAAPVTTPAVAGQAACSAQRQRPEGAGVRNPPSRAHRSASAGTLCARSPLPVTWDGAAPGAIVPVNRCLSRPALRRQRPHCTPRPAFGRRGSTLRRGNTVGKRIRHVRPFGQRDQPCERRSERAEWSTAAGRTRPPKERTGRDAAAGRAQDRPALCAPGHAGAPCNADARRPTDEVATKAAAGHQERSAVVQSHGRGRPVRWRAGAWATRQTADRTAHFRRA